MEGERRVVSGCPNAGNPFHECADYCNGQRSKNPSKLRIDNGGGKTPVRSGEGLKNVDPDCVNASNPFHQCADYCTKKTSENGKSVLLKLSPRSSSGRSDGGKSVPNGKILGVDGRKVDPYCINASNPFHRCGDYCTNKTKDVERQIRTGKTAQNGELSKEVRKIGGGSKVDPTCANASNPFHQCTEHCSEGSSGAKRGTLGALLARESDEEMSTRENKKEVIIRERGKVDPRCPNASNPFHECAEYCLPKISGSVGSEKGKPDRSKGSASILFEKGDVDPRCVNASNPFHKCAEYCVQRIRETT
ncbi:uncharacterized protein LOC109834202 isoform X2 [Asparagus officinalis]|uniref:uncharacterized protein LOC109834202 isoform X2 n=1 Tax=Asparagus officinalis TaxID=4686 RepID=UPI00098E4190|nr:uncharacterized protein LOC109834202 isoform X2 [Asparagus officinalis]